MKQEIELVLGSDRVVAWFGVLELQSACAECV